MAKPEKRAIYAVPVKVEALMDGGYKLAVRTYKISAKNPEAASRKVHEVLQNDRTVKTFEVFGASRLLEYDYDA